MNCVDELNFSLSEEKHPNMWADRSSYWGYKINIDIVPAIEKLSLVNKLINDQCFKYVGEDSFNGGMFVLNDYHLCLHI